MGLGTIGTASRLTAQTARALRDVATWQPNFGQQAKQLGVDSIPIGILIAGFTGIVLALLASYSFTGGIAGNVASVAERVRVAFDDSAARELRTTIRNFNTMSTQLTATVRTQSRNLDSVAANVRVGAQDLSTGMLAFQRSVSRLDSATSQGEVERIIGETQQAAINLRAISERLATMSVSLQQTEGSLRSALGKADTIFGRIERGEGSLGLLVNDPSLYRNSDSLMVDLRSLIADFRRNPKRYVNLSIF